jgi:predicted  nucleic acid-binding Zn-ribbon protein
MKYICNQCGVEFTSKDEAIKRSCPHCNSEANQHIPQPFGTPSEYEGADLTK